MKGLFFLGLGLLMPLMGHAVDASKERDTEMPAVEFFGGSSNAKRSDDPEYGLLIEGQDDQPTYGKSARGLLITGGMADGRILYEDDYHRVVGSRSRPYVQMLYRHDPQSSEWKFDGNVVRGHVPRGSKFGWTVSVIKPYMAIMDWRAKPVEAAIIIYEKTPASVRGWKKRFEVVAENADQAKCMGGLEADKWLSKWIESRGAECGVRTLDGTQATMRSVQNANR